MLTASIPVDIVDDFFTPLETRGHRPAFMTSGGYAASMYLLEREKDVKDALFLDLGEQHTVICAAFGRKIIKVRVLKRERDVKLLVKIIHQTLLGFTLRYDVDFVPEICFVSSVDEEK